MYMYIVLSVLPVNISLLLYVHESLIKTLIILNKKDFLVFVQGGEKVEFLDLYYVQCIYYDRLECKYVPPVIVYILLL